MSSKQAVNKASKSCCHLQMSQGIGVLVVAANALTRHKMHLHMAAGYM
jgi:hypothetical protein